MKTLDGETVHGKTNIRLENVAQTVVYNVVILKSIVERQCATVSLHEGEW